MEGASYRPRNLGFGELITVLVSEHAAMRAGLEKAKEAASRHDFRVVGFELRKLDPLFRQHITDEESQVLRLLVGTIGKERAAEEIRVFQQHRPIFALMQKASELATLSSDELEAKQEELSALFEEHALAEQARVFPKALSLAGGGSTEEVPFHDRKI